MIENVSYEWVSRHTQDMKDIDGIRKKMAIFSVTLKSAKYLTLDYNTVS